MLSHHAVLSYVPNNFVLRDFTRAYEAHAEVDVVSVERLSIKDVRDIIDRAYQTPFEKPLKICIVHAVAIAHEAQQALLKILEEPPRTTQFLLLLPREIELLPTIYSRVVVESLTESRSPVTPLDFKQFLQLPVSERHAAIARAVKQKDDMYFGQLREGLTQWLLTHATTVELRAIPQLHAALYGTGASKKMLWEALAFQLPVVPVGAQ